MKRTIKEQIEYNNDSLPKEFTQYLREDYTCDKCGLNMVCNFAFDIYNTNGECLANK